MVKTLKDKMTTDKTTDVSKNLRTIFDEYAKKLKVSLIGITNLKSQYIAILNAIDNEETEKKFINAVGTVYGLPFVESENFLIEKINYNAIQKVGFSKIIENNRIPLMDGAIATFDPFVDFYGTVYLITRQSLMRLIDYVKKSFSGIADVEISDRIDDIDIEKFLSEVLHDAYSNKCSDVHIEYNPVKNVSIIRIRKDGLLLEYKAISSLEFHEKLVNKIFEKSGINTNDFIRLHDKRIVWEIFQKQVPIRVSAVPINLTGERKVSNVVLRILSGTINVASDDFKSLGYYPEDIEEIEKIISLPYGLVVVCGPTGSGKSTLLYTILHKKSQEPIKIVTIEDPVEIPLGNITQVEVREARDERDSITFSAAIRSFLRHDPDVILIGETRDSETASEAVRASITGHLVFTTLHTNTSVGVIPRLLDLGVSPNLLAESLKYVIAQRLVRRLCDNCKIEVYTANPSDVEKYFGMDVDDFEVIYKNFVDKRIYVANPEGCKECINGYKGRTTVYEILKVEDSIVDSLVEGKTISYKEAFIGRETKTFSYIATRKILDGYTTIKEVERYIIL